MPTNLDIRYKTVELLEKISLNSMSVIKIEYKNCWIEVVNNFIFIKIHNEGNSFITKIHKLDLITAIKTDH